VPTSDRITIPAILAEALREDGEQDPPASEVRGLLPRGAVPWLVGTYEELRRMPLDARDWFVLSLVDGRSSVQMIVDLSAMPEAETLAVLVRLLKAGAIELHDSD
jgi:hypothetical protein